MARKTVQKKTVRKTVVVKNADVRNSDTRNTSERRASTMSSADKQNLLDTFLHWLPLAFAITMLSGMTYATGQQVLRQSANDPQIEIAQTATQALSQGLSPSSLNTAQRVDISNSLAPYIMVFDDKNKLVATNASLNGKAPSIPKGVFDQARKKGEYSVTYQPSKSVREALVVDHFTGKTSGFVVAGRSIKEVEKREDQLGKMIALGWLASLLGSFLVEYLAKFILPSYFAARK